MNHFARLLLGVAALSLSAPVSARAAFFSIDDTRSDDFILFSANDFEMGITVDGMLLQSGLSSPGSSLLPEADVTGQPIRHTFHGEWQITRGSPLHLLPRQITFLEPDPTGGSL